jgi:SAM-dependent methyltransferase
MTDSLGDAGRSREATSDGANGNVANGDVANGDLVKVSADVIVEEMQTYYARRAPVYDASMGYDDPAKVALVRDIIASLQRQLEGREVLELACGPGFWTQFVSEVARSITATDYNETTLAQARLKRFDRRNVSLRVADAYDLSSVAGDFDAAYAVDWFAHVPMSRVQGFLSGLHQHLRPGARVVFCDQLPGAESLTGMRDGEGNHLQERTLQDGSSYRVIKHFLSDDELHEMFGGHTDELEIQRYPECRRIVVGYAWAGQMPAR